MKKLFLISILAAVVLFSFSAALAQDTTLEEMINMIRTEVASTVVAEIQQTLASDNIEIIVRNQSTPSPQVESGFVWGTWKPTPTYYSYAAKLIGGGPNKNYFRCTHGQTFSVSWSIQNIGPLPWKEGKIRFRFYKGQESLDGTYFELPYVEKRDTITVTLSFECAEKPGIYNSYWELVDNNGAVLLDGSNGLWVGWQVDDWRQ